METAFDIVGMRERLAAVLEKRGISHRRASLDAGLAHGYVHSILIEKKEPTVTRLAAVCRAANVSLLYIMYGVEASPDTEEVIRRLEANPGKISGILSLLSD